MAAGAGRRYGGPKALAYNWLEGAIDALEQGGCAQITVVVGAKAESVMPRIPASASVCIAKGWSIGLGESLRAGLTQLQQTAPTAPAVVVHLVDLPDVGWDVVERVVRAATDAESLVRASYSSIPGHPVLLGRDHWEPISREATGDRGARDYLNRSSVKLVECSDLASGVDVDEPTSEGDAFRE
ncbi:hypothetical protein CHR55_33150 [Rhodococcus qingshengii]|uniref:MobA-like NTP transferase domain-containing protein n=2 Tax=Rhodococcus qingshengii TaxID=334542 RepID=A0A2A5IYJ8_RHOSG|nr:NTP transferase domain-containing protein [Rhodococcus qingshengii]PCK22049.1 hypothetical protein CHR55_33150 [Rhodococcus qingshengii]